MVALWSSFTWTGVLLAFLAGLAVCELNLFLTTAVLHRGMTHGAITYNKLFERLTVLWLWLTVCIPPLTWIAAHKHHHAHSDTEEDPHAPGEKGVWRVILLTWYYVPRWARRHWEYAETHYLRPFQDEKLYRFLDRPAVALTNFYLQIALSLLLGPIALAFWLGRIVPYMIGSGYVNAVGHTFGERPWPNLGTDASRLWHKLFGYLIGGEPLGHNFHHRHPRSPSFRPERFDPGLWFATRVLRGKPLEREFQPYPIAPTDE